MKRVFYICTVLIFMPLHVYADSYVKGYTKKDGTYVAPHYRSSRDGNPYNNYSTKGNVNPYSGKKGTAEPSSSYRGSSYNNAPYKGNSSGANIQSDGSFGYRPY